MHNQMSQQWLYRKKETLSNSKLIPEYSMHCNQRHHHHLSSNKGNIAKELVFKRLHGVDWEKKLQLGNVHTPILLSSFHVQVNILENCLKLFF